MRKLPPLTATVAFEAVARLGSVRAAADELNVTQSSISHQIAKLEDHFRVQLFQRRSKRLFLTTGGQDYFKIIEPVLDSIANTTYNVAKDAKRETLTVSAPPSFIVTWLLPRIDSFLKTHSELNLRLIDRMTLDLDDKSIDCAIEYRFEATKDVQSTRLLPDEVVVLAAHVLRVLRRHEVHVRRKAARVGRHPHAQRQHHRVVRRGHLLLRAPGRVWDLAPVRGQPVRRRRARGLEVLARLEGRVVRAHVGRVCRVSARQHDQARVLLRLDRRAEARTDRA